MQIGRQHHPSLASFLERERLEHRSRRISAVLRQLRERDELYVSTGRPRPPLQAAIADFEAELRRTRRRLSELRRTAPQRGHADVLRSGFGRP